MEKYTTYYGVAKKDFYTNANVQTQYKKYIATLVNRYKASTSIFAWELANEPRCPGCATSVITNWATSISAYIKSLDSTHMVAIGDEGFMNGGGDGSYPYTIAEGIDFAQNIKIPVSFRLLHISSLTTPLVYRFRHVPSVYRRLGYLCPTWRKQLVQKPCRHLPRRQQTLRSRGIRHKSKQTNRVTNMASGFARLARYGRRYVLAMG
jgi:hypothetical protein